MLDFDGIIALIIGGFCAGLGSSIGSYFAQKGFIKNLEKIGKIK